MTTLSDPVALRSVHVTSVTRECARIPAARIEAGWHVLIEDRWFRVIDEPELLGDDLDDDGGRVRLHVTGPGVSVLDMVVFRRGERVWCRAPRPDVIPTLGCADADCPVEGPYTLTEAGLLCRGNLAAYALAETAGPDVEQEADRG